MCVVFQCLREKMRCNMLYYVLFLFLFLLLCILYYYYNYICKILCYGLNYTVTNGTLTGSDNELA